MKKLSLLICILIFSCSENPEIFIEHIHGYWEIESVTFYDGDKKDYKYSESIDYISLNDSLKGFRKKLKPGINNTYFVTNDAEAITIKIENDSLNIYYSTPFAKWKETVLSATPEQLVIINATKAIYTYKSYTPIVLDVN
ncbi:lipocalin family protein [Winogradskyella sp. UBA3174]|uniref:lipocalin family protein n=1 Tax=Winogradskyella sp. UBA3174 TaxID=1947785 RepID=UPI0025E65892|nr:lipocalin family protein [Winogradskyella sp. UBA3174]|tara:strand:+ start:70273 stop:70692 length:420 start_codon:yes stop_codon:yes gene_type:complete